MDSNRLANALEALLGKSLAQELSSDFVKIRLDFSTKTLERASCGKFVETFVQCLQQIAKGKFDAVPKVDDYLNNKVEHESSLSEGLRVCAARTARSIYTLRNKRNIAHKNQVDPNTFDLAYIHQAASWIMAELIRTATNISMQEAGSLIELVQAPVGTLVEEIDGVRIVHADVSIEEEVLILLHSHYPEYVSVTQILESLRNRNSGSVRNSLAKLRNSKFLHGDSKVGYRLTLTGHSSAFEKICKLKTA